MHTKISCWMAWMVRIRRVTQPSTCKKVSFNFHYKFIQFYFYFFSQTLFHCFQFLLKHCIKSFMLTPTGCDGLPPHPHGRGRAGHGLEIRRLGKLVDISKGDLLKVVLVHITIVVTKSRVDKVIRQVEGISQRNGLARGPCCCTHQRAW